MYFFHLLHWNITSCLTFGARIIFPKAYNLWNSFPIFHVNFQFLIFFESAFLSQTLLISSHSRLAKICGSVLWTQGASLWPEWCFSSRGLYRDLLKYFLTPISLNHNVNYNVILWFILHSLGMCDSNHLYCKTTYGMFVSYIALKFLSSFICRFQEVIISFGRSLGDGGQWYITDLHIHNKEIMPVTL